MKDLFDMAKLIRIGIVALGCLGAWVAVKVKYEGQGARKESARVEQRGEINAQKANAARRAADKLPPGRLCDKYARDC